ncbi:unnamed protein product [Adineta ricciae]|uniref:Uncharacterized protein n=1 Tax=Adineta ricciae TaxID=249248 RepID=A0A813T1M6_ADIRI|nr:unnamed protein product [Adineta ricciae]
MIEKLIVISLILSIRFLDASHFRGGTITWRPWNATPSGSSANFLIRERFSWRRSFTPAICYCDDTTIATKGLIGESDLLSCTAGSCSAWTPMSTRTSCTDYSTKLDVSSGERFNTSIFPLNISFTLYYSNNAWLNELVLGGGSYWFIACRVNTALRPDGYLNTSPVAVTIPIVYKEINIQHVHVIQMSDFDGTDTLRCRWSNASGNINQYDECGGICMGVPGASLISSNCTIVFTLTVAYKYAGVALQIEDYYSASSTTPMSSVPLQFLFYGYPTPSGCSIPPTIIGDRPNRACIGTPIGSNVTEYVIVQVGCTGQRIVEFVSTSPIGMKKSAILNPSAGIYQLILSWIPTADQYGPQSFCAGAVDNSSLQSNQWCITFLVGFESPNVIQPTFVQGSASPIGTVFQNQTTFSIQTTKSVNRPTRNGTYIYFWDSTLGGTLVQKYDCGWEPEVTYTGFTTIIRFPVAPWIRGHFYYVTFDYGVASGTEYCGPESPKITDPTFWVFNIWDPAHSSTTTTTTTPMSTVTVTTRPTSTTSINTLLTTTGIVITTTTPATTTSQPSTTASLVTTIGTTVSVVTTEAEIVVIYPTDIVMFIPFS